MRTVCLRYVPHKSASDVRATLADFERYPKNRDADSGASHHHRGVREPHRVELGGWLQAGLLR